MGKKSAHMENMVEALSEVLCFLYIIFGIQSTESLCYDLAFRADHQ